MDSYLEVEEEEVCDGLLFELTVVFRRWLLLLWAPAMPCKFLFLNPDN
jgi:hypothetical protein